MQELATLLVFFDALSQETRTGVLALYNVGSAAAVALGSLLGAGLFTALGAEPAAYAALFAVSSIARMATLPLLRGVGPPKGPPGAGELDQGTFVKLSSCPPRVRPAGSGQTT